MAQPTPDQASPPPDRVRGLLHDAGKLQPVLVPLYAVLVALVVAGVVILLIGKNPIEAYWALLRGMFGTPERIAASLGRSTPFIGAALAVAFAFKAGLFNIGAEGQLLVGATMAAWVGTWSWLAGLPGILLIPIILLAGIVGGGLYGLHPRRAEGSNRRARGDRHDHAQQHRRPLRPVDGELAEPGDPARRVGVGPPHRDHPRRRAVSPSSWAASRRSTSGSSSMIGLCAVVWFILRRTNFGFEVRTVGINPNAARYAGMGVNRTIILGDGDLRRLRRAGRGQRDQRHVRVPEPRRVRRHRLRRRSPSRCSPAPTRSRIILTSILWGSMLSGAGLMQQESGLSIDAVRIVQALVLLFVAADVIVRTIFRLKRDGGAGSALAADQVATGWGAT